MMKMNNKGYFFFLLISLLLVISCDGESNYFPKPKGKMRMSFPERVYETYNDQCPFYFEVPSYFQVQNVDSSCNKNFDMGSLNATLFLTYLPVDTNLKLNIEYARKLAYEHSVKADEIREFVFINRENNAYGLSFEIVGNAASPYQFYLTDSARHFLRGALYFNTAPNYDSLKSSLEYIQTDLQHMIATTQWR